MILGWNSRRMTFRKLVNLGLLLAAGGVVFAEEAKNANAGTKRVLVLGDSITAGYGLDPDQAYPAILQEKIDAAALSYTVVNAGVSGDTSAGGLRRINWALGQKGADVLVIALGGNDGLRGISPAETEQNLAGIVEKSRAKNPSVKVVIAGMEMPTNLGADFVAQFKAVFPKVAAETKSALVPFLLAGVGGDEKLNQPDRIHPTAEGQRLVADNVWKTLEGVLVD
jgi:acyl-CoA thioesterase I